MLKLTDQMGDAMLINSSAIVAVQAGTKGSQVSLLSGHQFEVIQTPTEIDAALEQERKEALMVWSPPAMRFAGDSPDRT